MTDEELCGRFVSGLSLRTRDEVEAEIKAIRRQTALVLRQAREVEAAIYENQDDARCHHGHSGRRTYRGLTPCTVIQFRPAAGRRPTEGQS